VKILHINDTYAATGGITRYIFDVTELLELHGHENVIIYRKQHERTVVDGRKTYYVSSNADNLGGRGTIRRIIFQQQPDLIYLHAVYDPRVVADIIELAPAVAYVHGFHTVCPGLAKYFRRGDAICTRAFGWGCVPMIYARRCASARHPRSVWRIMGATAAHKQAYQRLPRILVASNYMRNLLLQNGFHNERVTVLAYPQKPVSPVPYPNHQPKRILYAGRLEIEKGVPYLLRTLTHLKMPCELRVAGDGTLRATYETLVGELGLAERVHFLGWLDESELDAEYRESALVVMPSICPEAFGQVGVQAMLHCRPVVAFKVGGIPDWLKDGEHGFLVEPRNVQLLAARIGQLLKDSSLAQEMGTRGREFALRQYAPEEHIAQLLAAFGQIVRNGVKQ